MTRDSACINFYLCFWLGDCSLYAQFSLERIRKSWNLVAFKYIVIYMEFLGTCRDK